MMSEPLSPDINEFLERTSTQNFISAAERFVELLETKNIANAVFFPEAHTALLDLYSAGLKLDIIELKYSSNNKEYNHDITLESKNIGQISELGDDVFYWEIFDPTYSESKGKPKRGWKKNDKQALQHWLVNDFADIYSDIKTDLLKIESIGTDEAVEDALWDLKWSFANHWGRHCINALRYLHFLYYDGKQTL